MSPEQVKELPLTHQTDIFSLGVVMYQLLTGRLPFQGTNNYSMIYQIINVDPPRPIQVRPDLPPRVDAIVMRALQKDTAARYQTWEEMAHDLATALGTEEKLEQGFAESEKFDTLRKLEFFGHFSDVELWEVLRLAAWHKHPPDTTLIHENDIGSSFFILVAGEVKVVKQERLLNVLKPGECFGEMAYLGKQKFQRSASVGSRATASWRTVTASSMRPAPRNRPPRSLRDVASAGSSSAARRKAAIASSRRPACRRADPSATWESGSVGSSSAAFRIAARASSCLPARARLTARLYHAWGN